MDKYIYWMIWGFLFAGIMLAQKNEVPQKPHNLRAMTRLEGAVGVVDLSWRDGSNNETGFEILRSENGKEFKVVKMIGANTSHYVDEIGKYLMGSFAYKIRAFNEKGRSQSSETVSVWF